MLYQRLCDTFIIIEIPNTRAIMVVRPVLTYYSCMRRSTPYGVPVCKLDLY
eukprot:SAG11_NODE_1109_length_5830_cov_4.525388_5_plen_51_part_00